MLLAHKILSMHNDHGCTVHFCYYIQQNWPTSMLRPRHSVSYTDKLFSVIVVYKLLKICIADQNEITKLN